LAGRFRDGVLHQAAGAVAKAPKHCCHTASVIDSARMDATAQVFDMSVKLASQA
jgi:hypothetical protein